MHRNNLFFILKITLWNLGNAVGGFFDRFLLLLLFLLIIFLLDLFKPRRLHENTKALA